MKNDRNKNIIIGLMGVIIAILVMLIAFNYNGIINFKQVDNNDNNRNSLTENKETNNATSPNKKNITQQTFEDLIKNELYILDDKKSINEITNEDKLTLAFNLLESKYIVSDGAVSTKVDWFLKERLDEIFSESCISNLGITHKSFDVYEYTQSEAGNYYNKNNLIMSKRNLMYMRTMATKTIDFKNENNKYTLSMVKLLGSDTDSWDRGYCAYGKSEDLKNETNCIVKASTESSIITKKEAQDYLNSHYEEIKDKLNIYHYVFEKTGDKLNLVDYSIN